MEESESVILLKTHDPFYAETVKDKLSAKGISCEILDAQFSTYGEGETSALRLLVPADQAGAAKKVLAEEALETAPDSSAASTGFCCPGCGFESSEMDPAVQNCPRCEMRGEKLTSLGALETVLDYAPGTRGICESCREISVHAEGACLACGQPLRPALPQDKLCPNKLHSVDTTFAKVGVFVCRPCATAWTLGQIPYLGGCVRVPIPGRALPEGEAEPAPEKPKVHCPHCKASAPDLLKNLICPECGFAVLFIQNPSELLRVLAYASTTKTFCPECRQPSTFEDGMCGLCDGTLKKIDSKDLLCPAKEHVLDSSSAAEGLYVCVPCEKVLARRSPA